MQEQRKLFRILLPDDPQAFKTEIDKTYVEWGSPAPPGRKLDWFRVRCCGTKLIQVFVAVTVQVISCLMDQSVTDHQSLHSGRVELRLALNVRQEESSEFVKFQVCVCVRVEAAGRTQISGTFVSVFPWLLVHEANC